MATYHLVVFVHVMSVLVLFIAMGVSHVSIERMEKATTRSVAIDHCKTALDNGPRFTLASLFIVATGLYLSSTAWSVLAPWVIVSLTFVVVSTAIGFVVMYPRLARINGYLTALPDGELPPDAPGNVRDPVASLLPSALAGNALATVMVMFLKPGWMWTGIIFVAISLLGMVPVWGRAQEAWRARRRTREMAKNKREHLDTPILCDVLDPKLVVVETISPYTLKAHKALKAAGIEYITRRATQSGDYKHLNPKGQIPILLIGDQILSGSRDIVRMCAKRAPHKFEQSLTPQQDAEVHFWEEYSENIIKGFIGAARWIDEENWARAKMAYFVDMPALMKPILIPRIRKAIIRGLKASDVWRGTKEEERERYMRELDGLELRAPETGFWIGTAKLTPADISVYAFLQCLRTSITPWYYEQIQARRKLRAYLDRVEAACSPQALEAAPPLALVEEHAVESGASRKAAIAG